MTQTASDGPEWSGLGSQRARPRLEGWRGGDTGGFPATGLCELRPEGQGEVRWVGISVWLRAGSLAPGTVPRRGWPQCGQSRDPVRTLVSGYAMWPRQPLVVLPASFPREQGVRAERPPSPAQRWDCRWAAVQENRFGGGSPVGGGWGPKQPTCLNWPGPPGQQGAPPGKQTWPGWGRPLLQPLLYPHQAGSPFNAAPPFQPPEHCPFHPPRPRGP